MKRYSFIILQMLSILLLGWSCSQDDLNDHKPIDTNTAKPGMVSDVQVINKSGAASIIYKLPDDENLQYVMAQYYTGNNELRESKTSRYNDTLHVEGFDREGEFEVKLYSVSRAEVKSEPLTIKVHPQTPVYRKVASTLSMLDDFGGVNINYQNPEQAKLAVVVITEDRNGEFIPVESYYSQIENGNFSVRGYNTDKRIFGVYIKDRWNNYSDTLFKEITPMYETRIDKSKFRQYVLPNDQGPGWGWVMTNLWDNNLESGFHTLQGAEPRPHRFTFDMGIVAKLSRFKILQRAGEYLYMHGNPRQFNMWGTAETPHTSGSWDGWIKLMECNSFKPSGTPMGQYTEDDRVYAMGTDGLGEEFIFPLTAPPVRYIRMEILRNWGNTDFFHAMEITFWGSPQ